MADDVRRIAWRAWMAGVVIGVSAVTAGCEQVTALFSGKSPASGTPASSGQAQAGSSAASASAVSMPQPVVAPAEVIAHVNGRTISRRDVELAIQDLKNTTEALGREWTTLSDDDLKELTEGLIIGELRAQDALARGLDRQTEVQQRWQHRARTFFAQEWVARQLNQAIVSQAEVDQFYQNNQAGFREPERIRLRQAVFASEEQAKAALVKLLEGVDMPTVAQGSVRPEAATGPLVEQWVMRSTEKAVFAPNDEAVRDLRDPALEQAAFAIDKVGGTSSYVKGADGNSHVFQLVEKKPGRQRALVEVQDNIRNFLQLQKLNEATKALDTKAKIERSLEHLKQVTQ